MKSLQILCPVFREEEVILEFHARLRAAVICEWTETVNTPAAQTRFKHFINSTQRDPNVQVVAEREQHRPATPYERIPVTLVEENA